VEECNGVPLMQLVNSVERKAEEAEYSVTIIPDILIG